MSRVPSILIFAVGLFAFSASFLATESAEACSYVGHPSHTTSDEEPPDDVDPPSKVSIDLEATKRGKGPRSDGVLGKQTASSCDDQGFFRIGMDPHKEDWGYRTEVVSGNLPDSAVPKGVVRGNDGQLQFNWTDGARDKQEPIEATIRITPVDKWGREGPPSEELTIRDPGRSASACSATGTRRGPGPLGAVIVVLGLVGFTRRQL